MFKNQEQVTLGPIDLQFFAEPGDIGTADPPASGDVFSDPAPSNPAPEPSTQATPPVQNEPSTGIPDEIKNSKFYQDAVRGMNDAQRQAAELRKQSEQFQAVNQFGEMVRNIAATQGPQAAINLIATQFGVTPQQAVQMVQQPESENPYKDEEWYQLAKAELRKELEGEITPYKQFMANQQRQEIMSQVDSKFNEVQSIIPDVGREAFNSSLSEMALYPQHAEYAAIHAAGGLKSFADKIAANAVLKYQQDLKTKNTVSPTLTNPGPQVTQQKAWNPDDPFDHNESWSIVQATKAQRLGDGG